MDATEARPLTRSRGVAAHRWDRQRVALAAAAPLLVPLALLLAGSLVGLPWALSTRVALERLVGYLVAGMVGVAVLAALRRAPERSVALGLLAAALLGLAGALWVIAADPRVFRGPIGVVLQVLFAPLAGRVVLTEPIEVINTRFVAGYNGMADLCLLMAFTSAGILTARPPARGTRLAAGALLVVSLTFLVGTGSRGGLAGLVAGAWVMSLVLGRLGVWVTLGGVVAALGLAGSGLLSKGFDVSSTTGRFVYWGDLARVLTQYPFTGVGLGLDTANAAALRYEVNPDPERIAYAHNTFVQTYLEQGPLGTAGMLLLPVLVLLAAVLARRQELSRPRRALLLAGVGTAVGLEVHGLTDQALTTTIGMSMLFASAAAVLACLDLANLARVRAAALGTAGLVAVATLLVGLAVLAIPPVRATAFLNLGALQVNNATLRPGPADGPRLVAGVRTLEAALALEPGSAAIRSNLARAYAADFNTGSALAALEPLRQSDRLDGFDTLQVAQALRDLGFANDAYRAAALAYQRWGRPPSGPVMQVYRQATLPDDSRVRTLADQAEQAMRFRLFDQAVPLFRAALTFAPENAYLLDRLGEAERGLERASQRP